MSVCISSYPPVYQPFWSSDCFPACVYVCFGSLVANLPSYLCLVHVSLVLCHLPASLTVGFLPGSLAAYCHAFLNVCPGLLDAYKPPFLSVLDSGRSYAYLLSASLSRSLDSCLPTACQLSVWVSATFAYLCGCLPAYLPPIMYCMSVSLATYLPHCLSGSLAAYRLFACMFCVGGC